MPEQIEQEKEKLESENQKELSYSELLDLNKALTEKLKPFLEAKAPDRNFEIEIQEKDKQASIVLKKEDGESRNLSEFLPKGFKFETADTFNINFFRKKVHFDPQTIDQRDFLLSLGHEIGHSRRDKRNLLKRSWTILSAGIQTLSKVLQEVAETAKKTRGLSKKEQNKLLDEFTSKTKSSPESFFPTQFTEKYDINTAKSERTAWAEGLKILRELSKEGYDVLSGFNSSEEIKVYTAYCLFTHELHNIKGKLLASGPEKEIEHELKTSKPDDIKSLLKALQSISESEGAEK